MITQSRLVTKEILIDILITLIHEIKIERSFEGCFRYTAIAGVEHEHIPAGHYEVEFAIRLDNKLGESGYMCSTVVDPENI
jgi:hypothetical protein